MRLIDVDKLRKHERSVNDGNVIWLMDVYLPEDIDNAPTVQAVPIEVLDKIRAEIEDEGAMFPDGEFFVSIYRINEIIDKYTKGDAE